MQLVKYLLKVIIMALLLTSAVTWVANKGLRSSGTDFYGKMNAVLDSTKKNDLLLVGSSRVLVHLDPFIIDSMTGLNSYNFGFNSATIKTCFNIISGALFYKKHVKAIVLNIDYTMFNIENDPYKDAYYFPFENAGLDIKMNDSGNINMIHKIKLLDVSLYDDYVKYAAIDGWLRPKRILAGYKGYEPHHQLNDFEDILKRDTFIKQINYPPAGFKLLADCISLCKQKNVKLLLVIAPYYKNQSPYKYYSNFPAFVSKINEVANQNNIQFYNFANIDFAGDPQYFYNVNHLNIKGASLYTRTVAESLKKYLALKN